MAQRRLFWHFYVWFLVITLLSVAVISIYATGAFDKFFYQNIQQNLQIRANLVGQLIEPYYTSGDFDKLDKLCKQIGKSVGIRITVIEDNGKVLGDSQEDPAVMDNHSLRPEVLEAKSKGFGLNTRFSDTIKSMLIYAAVSYKISNGESIIVRTSLPIDDFNARRNAVFMRIIQFGIIIAVILAAISLLISNHISKPIELIKEGAQRFAKGQLTSELAMPKSKELASLAGAFNKMADDLNQRIETISSQRNLFETVLSSMTEGVIAFDSEGQILSVNDAACDLLEINKADINEGKNNSIEEALRDAEIQQFVKRCLISSQPLELEMVFGSNREKFLHIYGRRMTGFKNGDFGAVVVFNDITRLKQLENIRRDFVANVSHELKTPITSIKGFVETLMDGAIDNKDDAQRFLDIIKRHSDRLTAIIEDLLLLCRIQEQGQDRKIRLESADIKRCIESAVGTCSAKAKDKNITISIESPSIPAQVDSFLIEQAFVNLIDNAIKYSEPDKEIKITAASSETNISIHIQDNGYGIAKEHIDRIFERFYVTDKARSRNLGGTGLGLAIVKHICQSHNGSVSVRSQLGKGSIFTINLPKI